MIADVCGEAQGMKVTDFQKRVYCALMEVPFGNVITYGALGRRIGCGSAQAVGQALRVNPFAPHVPCHRVVAADGSLCGFNGKREGGQISKKRRLLESEGVAFLPDGRIVPSAIIR